MLFILQLINTDNDWYERPITNVYGVIRPQLNNCIYLPFHLPSKERSTLALKKSECQKAGIELKKLQEKNEKDKVAHAEAVRHLQAVRVGMATSSEGKDASVDEQLRGT